MKRRILSVLGVLGILVTLSVIIVFAASATVLTTSSRYEHTCSGGSSYSFPYPVLSKDHLVVSKYLTASGFSAATTFTQNQHYTVTLVNNGQSATIALIGGASCATNYTLRIQRTVPVTQTTAFRTQGTYLPIAHENALDKLTMIIQQAQDGISQSAESAAAINDHINGAADPHDMYFILAGRAGGQVGYGGTASGNDLTLRSNQSSDGSIYVGSSHVEVDESTDIVTLHAPTEAADTLTCQAYLWAQAGLYGDSTSGADLLIGSSTHATKGQILMATNGLVVDEANNCVGIETVNPNCTTYKLDVTGAIFASTDVVLDGTLYGGDGASEGLAINSTSNATKGAINIASNLLYVNEATSRIGVNTASPGYLFDVNGSMEVDTDLVVEGILYGGDLAGESLALRSNSAAADGNVVLANGALVVVESPSDLVTISNDLVVDTSTLVVDGSDSRVGINDTTPDYLLDVEGVAYIGTQLLVGAAGATVDANAAAVNIGNGMVFVDIGGTGSVGIYDVTPNASYVLDIGGATQVQGTADIVGSASVRDTFTVDTNTLLVNHTLNRVGVGTASPATALNIEGVFRIEDSANADYLQMSMASSAGLIRTNETNSYATLQAGSSGGANLTVMGSTFTAASKMYLSAAEHRFYDAATSGLTMVVDTANDRVGIGDATPDYALDVEGSAYLGDASSGVLISTSAGVTAIQRQDATGFLAAIGGNAGLLGTVEPGWLLHGSDSSGVMDGEFELRSPNKVDIGVNANTSTSGELEVTDGVVTVMSGVDLVVDTDALFVDASAQRVGVNEESPDYTLDVGGTVAIGASGDDSLTLSGTGGAGTIAVSGTTLTLNAQYTNLESGSNKGTVCGGTGAGDDLVLWSTTSSDGYIYFGSALTSFFDEAGGDLLIADSIHGERPAENDDATLTTTDCNKVAFNNGVNATLPDASDAGNGCQITLVATATDASTGSDLLPAGTDYITGTCGTTVINDAQSVSKGAENTDATHKIGDSITVVSDGGTVWYIVACTGVWGTT